MSESDLELPIFIPNEQKLTRLGVKLQQTFGLDLFGFDVIMENVTGRYAIIDINTFPGMQWIQGINTFAGMQWILDINTFAGMQNI